MARLRLTVGDLDSGLPKSGDNDRALRVQMDVLDCVSALGELYTLISREQGRRGRLEQQIRETRTALAQANVELAKANTLGKRVQYRSLHDQVTLLPNNEYFSARLLHALDRSDLSGQALAVLYLRLEAFEPFLDTFGYSASDELLQTVAARLALTVRADDMLSRRGADSFACLVTGLYKQEQLSELATNLLGAVAGPLSVGIFQHRVRLNIGIAMYPAHGISGEALLVNAEAAMLRAQQQNTGFEFCGVS